MSFGAVFADDLEVDDFVRHLDSFRRVRCS